MEFGILTEKKRIIVDNIEIKPMWDLDHKIKLIHKNATVSNGWIYPPLIEAEHNYAENKTFKTKTFLPANYFQIEPTHHITIHPNNLEKLRFLILSYGFLNGIYLSPAGYICIHRIPYEVGKLTGVHIIENDAEKGIHAFSQCYDRLNTEKRNLAFSILHWFLVGQSYNYAWDKFDAQYKVLDAIYRFSGLQAKSHSQRPVLLAKHFGLKEGRNGVRKEWGQTLISDYE